jgi:hypothetical protein
VSQAPEVQIVGGTGSGPSPEEAAALVAAVEQFVRDHAPVSAAPASRAARWTSAALREGVSRAPDLAPFWA